MYQVATGGVKLQVPALRSSRKHGSCSAQLWTPSSTNDEQLDDAWDELAPEPGERRRRIMKGVIVFILFTPLMLIVLGWLFSARHSRVIADFSRRVVRIRSRLTNALDQDQVG